MKAHHARIPCNIARSVMHENRATSAVHTLHGNRATSATFETHNLARFFVQHHRPESCTAAVQDVMHGFSATKDNPPTYVGKDNPIPSCTACKTAVLPYRTLTANHLDQTSRRGNQLTARAERGVSPCQH
ncbi:hypothetical protein SEA_JORRAY_47 [Mycobacterium phage JorRay]|nr:hypothetical protein SEA_FROSTY24_47 [Mycobacterium phage Frosty24]URP21586.1 hypothetical protein SEA_JORRAY_47 [Mycobacterium phage JorRay]